MECHRDLELPEKLIEATTSPRDEAFISLLGRVFIRITKAVQIKLNDIDYEKEALSINSLREQINLRCLNCNEKLAKQHLFCPTCGNKVAKPLKENIEQRHQRVIPIDRGTLKSIEQYLEWRRRFPYRGELLFPFTRQRGWQLVERLGRRIGLRGLHPESLRHLLATRWVNKRLDVKILKYLLGYTNTAAQPPNFSFEQVKREYKKLWETGQDEK
jgi:integrase/recombinase XerD